MNHNNEKRENNIEDENIIEASTEFKRTSLNENIYGNRTIKKSKKGFKIFILFFIILIILIFIASILIYRMQISAIDENNEEKIKFIVEEGDTSDEISKTLLDAGLIRNELIFKIYLKINNINHFTEGKYKATKKDDLKEIVNMIVEGRTDKEFVIFQIIEGENIKSIAKEITKVFAIPEKDFFDTLKNTEYLDELINKYWFLTNNIKDERIYYSLEGYLFPDTYHFGKDDTTVKLIIETMLDRMEEILEPYKIIYTDKETDKTLMPIHQVITLASCTELEGTNAENRREIVGVFLNRLANEMSLGSDITTAYAFGVDITKQDLTQKQLDTENPYNTRGPNMIGKVPVGPICSPSKESIDATFNYKKTNNKYFVSDKNGKMYFTKTLSEHETLINNLKNKNLWFIYDD